MADLGEGDLDHLDWLEELDYREWLVGKLEHCHCCRVCSPNGWRGDVRYPCDGVLSGGECSGDCRCGGW